MNFTTHNDLIDSIRSLLEGRNISNHPEIVAIEYERLCREVNERLSRISPMLDEGGEIQALQIAEQAPRLVDLACVLSFGGENAWQEYCRSHGHEIAPLIDARTLERLLAVQEKGLSPNHALYKDYRAAISSKDDAKAYSLIKIVARLNPQDENANRELVRLEKKNTATLLRDLGLALANQDEGRVLILMSQLEESLDRDTYQNTPEWKKAVIIQHERKINDAHSAMPELIQMAQQKIDEGDWRSAAMWHNEFQSLNSQFGCGTNVPDLQQKARELEEALTKHREASERSSKIQLIVSEMCNIAEEVEIRAITPAGLSEEYCAAMLEELTRKWRTLEDLRGEMPVGMKTRVESTRQRLEQALQRAHTGRRGKTIALICALSALLIALILGGYFSYSANQWAKRLKKTRVDESTSACHSLVTQIKQSDSIFLKHSGLAAEVADAEKWLKSSESSASLVDSEITRLKKMRDDHFKDIETADLSSKLEVVSKMIEDLPREMRQTPSAELALLKNDAESVMSARQEETDNDANMVIQRWAQIVNEIDYRESVKVAYKALKDSDEELKKWLSLSNLESPFARLKPATEAELKNLHQKLENANKLILDTKYSMDELVKTKDPKVYHSLLKKIAEGSFKESMIASKIIDSWPADDDRIKAFLLFKNDLSALKTAENDRTNGLPIPESASKADREILRQLIANESLNETWDVSWSISNGDSFQGLAKDVEDGLPENWKGSIAKLPSSRFIKLEFQEVDTDVDKNININYCRISPNAKMMANLNLDKLLNPSGSEFRSSIIPLIERVMSSDYAHPLARAYVLDHLFRMVLKKEQLWGLQYCPQLYQDIQTFVELHDKKPVIENSWLLKEKTDQTRVWEEYFASRSGRSYSTNVTKMKNLIRAVSRSKINLVGRVYDDGKVEVLPSKSPRILLSFEEKTNGDVVFFLLKQNSESSEIHSSADIVPFSPIFAIEMTEESKHFLESMH